MKRLVCSVLVATIITGAALVFAMGRKETSANGAFAANDIYIVAQRFCPNSRC